jgi:ribosomal protein S18 acetylase RimI-like enzyme
MIHTTAPAPLVRWLVQRDLDDVLRIERESFNHAWNAQDFREAMKCTSIIGMVADLQTKTSHQIVGYMLYEVRKQSVKLINLAVDAKHRRTGAGRAMLLKITDKLRAHGQGRGVGVREAGVVERDGEPARLDDRLLEVVFRAFTLIPDDRVGRVHLRAVRRRSFVQVEGRHRRRREV